MQWTMIQRSGKVKNHDIFGKDCGRDPNHPIGPQLKLFEYEERHLVLPWRDRLKHCTSPEELMEVLYDNQFSKFQREVALNLYLRFDHPPLWEIAGNREIDPEVSRF
jgi:hypothetical protein